MDSSFKSLIFVVTIANILLLPAPAIEQPSLPVAGGTPRSWRVGKRGSLGGSC